MEITEFSKTVDHDVMHLMIDNASSSLSFPKYSIRRRCSTCTKDRFCVDDRGYKKKVSFFEAIYGNEAVSNAQLFNPMTPNCTRFPNQFTPSSFKFSPKNCSSSSTKKFLCSPYGHKYNHLKKPRIIETILDAPDVVNEFPSQLIDVSSTNSIIVALGSCVYCWKKGVVTEILQSESLINAVCWMDNNVVISAKGNVELWDVNQCKIIRSFQRHSDKVGTISTTCGNRVATGGRDSAIYVTDIRNNHFDPLIGHRGEITSVKWSPEGTFLASCSDADSKIIIWKNNEIKSILKDSRFQMNEESEGNYYSNNKITSLAWQSHHVLIAGDDSERGTVRYIPIHSNDDEKWFDTNCAISDISWSKKWGLAISHKGVNSFWEIRNNEFQRNAMVNGNMGDIVNIVTSEDDSLVATISIDETLRTYDLKDISHPSDGINLLSAQSELKNIGIR